MDKLYEFIFIIILTVSFTYIICKTFDICMKLIVKILEYSVKFGIIWVY